MAAELGEGTDQAFERLEAALKKKPQDSDLHYDAARAYALASQAVARKDPARSKSLSERALSLLRTAIENGYANYRQMQEDADLDPLRELPGVCRHHEGRAPGSLLRRRLDGRFPVRVESRPSVSTRPLISSGAANWWHRAIAWSLSRSPGLPPRDRRSPPRSGTAR